MSCRGSGNGVYPRGKFDFYLAIRYMPIAHCKIRTYCIYLDSYKNKTVFLPGKPTKHPTSKGPSSECPATKGPALKVRDTKGLATKGPGNKTLSSLLKIN